MRIPACGYVPSIGAGGKRFYLVRKDGHHLIFWYALNKRSAFLDAGSPAERFDIRALPAAYLEGLAVDHISQPLPAIRYAHRQALKRAVADRFHFAEHARTEYEKVLDTECAAHASAPPVEDDDVPF